MVAGNVLTFTTDLFSKILLAFNLSTDLYGPVHYEISDVEERMYPGQLMLVQLRFSGNSVSLSIKL